MRDKLTATLFPTLLLCLALSGCGTPKSLLFSQGVDTMSFHFGKTGAAKVAVSHDLSIEDYRADTLLPILTEVIQERLQARGFAAGEAKPSAGGWSQLDEFKLNGRTLILEFGWSPSGSLAASGGFYATGKKLATLTMWPPSLPAVPARSYASAENFYHGIKEDIAPIVDDALDFILDDLSAQGMPVQQ